MAQNSRDDDDTTLTPRDMKLWLRIEMKSARLAAERRIHEAKTFVDDYAAGHIDSDEANGRLQEHEQKWGNGAADSVLGSEIRDQASREVNGQSSIRQAPSTGKPRSR